MGIVRPVMKLTLGLDVFVPFIMLGTFTILNLFIGIIVSTMQEISENQPQLPPPADAQQLLSRIQAGLAALQQRLGDTQRGSKKDPLASDSLGRRPILSVGSLNAFISSWVIARPSAFAFSLSSRMKL